MLVDEEQLGLPLDLCLRSIPPGSLWNAEGLLNYCQSGQLRVGGREPWTKAKRLVSSPRVLEHRCEDPWGKGNSEGSEREPQWHPLR